MLLNILTSQGKDNPRLMLVFIGTQRMTDMLCDVLVNNHIPATSIHRDRIQREPEMALQISRTGREPILVDTAIAVRGLYIPRATHVVHHDFPPDIDNYVRPIGSGSG